MSAGTREGRFLIYGANGYTGRLLAERAAAEGELPILAGRRAQALDPLGEALDLPTRAFDLRSLASDPSPLADVDLVLHCAGPFSQTSAPMVAACLATGTHYVDITGEIEVFEAVHARAAEARERGVCLLPGAGFDVVPSDCLAASLAAALPGANSLELALCVLGGKTSPGTTKTLIEGLPQGGRVRRGGKIVRVPSAHRVRRVPFPAGERRCAAIPWGDVSTAFYSTQIPNITVYLALPGPLIAAMKVSSPFARLSGLPALQRALKRQAERWIAGPSDAERAQARTQLWGQVKHASGASLEATLETPEGYTHTVDAALAICERLLAGEVPPGAWTPSRAFGPAFVTSLPGCKLELPARETP